MQQMLKDGVSLAFHDSGSRHGALVLVHGWGCDHSSLQRQQSFFADTYRVISVDLRGHGESSSPEQIYSVEQFADDIAWLCQELDIEQTIIVGHSMGGSVAIETAYRYPQLVRAIGLIDTVFRAPVELQNILAPMLSDLQGAGYETAYRNIMSALSLPSEEVEVASLLGSLPRALQHVLLSALQQHLEAHDFARAAASCTVPVAYIGAARPLADLVQLKQLIPHIWIGQVLGAGHFAPWLVSEQVNAMLLRFFKLSADAT